MSRIRLFIMAFALVMTLVPAAALAADPTAEVAPGPATGHVAYQPLTRAQLRSVAVRDRLAVQLAATFGSGGSAAPDRPPCPSSPGSRVEAATGSGSCVSDFVAINPRQQVKWNYCGPATVQQVINFTRGISTDNNAVNIFTQQQISDWWLKTDANGGTSPSAERVGMNAGSRLPAGFAYAEYRIVSGADWHSRIVTDVTGWNMPLTAVVAPHDVNFDSFLASWAEGKPVNTGHWIVVRGYYLNWDGTRNPLVYYTDSSGGLGGSTGRFYDPSFTVYQTLIKTNAVHSQGRWIVW